MQLSCFPPSRDRHPEKVGPRTPLILSRSLLFLLVALQSLQAATFFYVDSDWNGAQSGTTAQPWKSLSGSAWTSVNNALANGDVTVYFSAREASSNVDDIYDTNGDGNQDGIDLTNRNDKSGSVLTLDGNATYNTSDTSPNWASYAGNSKSRVGYLTAQNSSHVKYSNITIRGFHVVTWDGNKEIAICGDNWIIENCECEHTSTATNGPGVILVPTADSAHEGSSAYAPPCTNIIIRNNVIHDTQGEALYVGGGGVMDGAAGAGYPSHSNITIEGNVIYNAGTRGGQGDGIDIKGGLSNVTVRANEIYNINDPSARAIVTQGQMPGASQRMVIERNRIHDCSGIEDAAIAVSNSWGTAQGITIRNNVIDKIDGGGVKIYESQDTVEIYNNTISGCSEVGIHSTQAPITIKNNLLLGNNGGGPQVSLSGGPVLCDYNAYSNSWGYPLAGPSSINLGATAPSSVVENAAGSDLRLKAGSPVIGRGTVLSGFSNDVTGSPRGASWDIGAYQYSTGGTPPPPPAPTATPTPTPTPPPAPTATPAPAAPPPQAPAAPPPPPTGLTFQATSGVISAPFTTESGILSQPIETDLSDSGRASYSFNIPLAGNYIITARVNAPSGGANSLFVNIDAEPTDPTMIWDVLPTTAGFEPRTVGWRGNGTFDSPQFPTKVFWLSVGTHTLIIRGREALTGLDVITITPKPTPTPVMLDATTGTVSAPFVAADGYISQPIETPNLDGGRAVYRFNIVDPGEYAVLAVVDAPTESQNSFYVNVDAEPIIPDSTWHIPVTSGFEERLCSWQGTGSFAAPQFVPKFFDLPAGQHDVIVRGRERNTKLKSLSLVKRSDAPVVP